MYKSKKRVETRRFISARNAVGRSKSTGEEKAVELEELPRNNVFVVNPSKQTLVDYNTNKKMCDSLHLNEDYFDNVKTFLESKPISDNDRILADDGEIFDFQYATRNHVKRMFTNSYEITILLKRIAERENLIVHEGHYRNNLDDCSKEETCKEKISLDLVLLDYKQRYEWTRSFVNMCQNKKLQLDIVSMLELNNALETIKQHAIKNKYVLTLSTLSEYYTMPLIECIISPEAGVVGIHVPLLKKELIGLAMKKIVTPTYAWNDYTCSVDVPSITVAITQTHDKWTILIPKCDPFKEELCLVTETRSAETLPLLCIKQVLTGGPIKQFKAVCPITCRETDLVLRCVDKTITYNRKQLLPAVWSQVPGLTLSPWDSQLLQFDSLQNCLDQNWIDENIKDSSTSILTYFVIINFLLLVSAICINVYLYFKLRRKFHHYQRQKLNPMEKSTFKLGTVKFTRPQQTFTRPQDRPLPDPSQEEECHYLTPQEINSPSTSTTTTHPGSIQSSPLPKIPMPTTPTSSSTITQPRHQYALDKSKDGTVSCGSIPHYVGHRLTAHMWKCHAQEAEAAKEADYQRKMKEWEQWEKERPAPIQPVVSCSGELPQPFENWDEDPSLPYICAAAKRRHYKK
ncbi:hypothetical protein FQR65_LT11862 [Abscondita terminalis]|nr:hypothetical protein FQR65_LT11862 [Abscondita terminalis]